MTDIRKLINILEAIEQDPVEDNNPEAGIVDQFVTDVKNGEIAPMALQAVTNYIKKKLGEIAGRKPEVAAPNPDNSEPSAEINEAAKMVMPDGVTLKPEELRKVLLKGGFKSEEVNNIITFAYRKTIELYCDQIAAMKMYKKEASEMLANIFLKVPGTLSQRNHIAHILTTTGVLDLGKFGKPHKGVFDDLITAEYKSNPIVMNLKIALKNRSDFPTQVSSASKGAGEDLISILGNPVNKLSPGDLNIDGKEIEIKAMGARLKGFGGTAVYGDAARIYTEWANLVTKAAGSEGMQVIQSRVKKGLGKYFHFSLDNLNVLEDAMQVSKVPQAGQYMREAFALLLETLYPQSDNKMRETVLRSFDSKGKFDMNELRKNWFLFSYDYYKKTTADKETGATMYAIMFFNQGTEAYQIVTDKKQIENSWDEYQLGTDLFNWTNPTGQAPKITLGTETRSRRSRSKTSDVKDPEKLAAQTHKVSGLKPQAAKTAAKSLAAKSKEPSPLRGRR